MLPARLSAAQFTSYPPQAERVAVAHLALLQQMPLAFLPSLLRELIEYDYKFPAERLELDKELAYLGRLTPAQVREWFSAFAQLRLSAAEESFDWVNRPVEFTEQLSAYLWSTQQIGAFRDAATAYGSRMRGVVTAEAPPVRRLGIAVIGQGVSSYDAPLFRNLRAHGTYFSQVDPSGGLQVLLSAAAARAEAHPVPYGHWYVDGGVPAEHSAALTSVSYGRLEPVRSALLDKIQAETAKPGMGPEGLRAYLMRLSPTELGMRGDARLDRFQVKLLTEGSGTQVFSTTFAQWTAREVLRRAEALTLVVRFAPRQRQRPMNELLSNSEKRLELDPVGSLIDAEMAAYYQWINQQRLSGSEQGAFLVWWEGQGKAVAIGPSLPRGAEAKSPIDMKRLLGLMMA